MQKKVKRQRKFNVRLDSKSPLPYDVQNIGQALNEGERKDLMDTHLKHRKMAEVEFADAIIRLADYAGEYLMDALHVNFKVGPTAHQDVKKFFYIVWSWFTRKDKQDFWLERADNAANSTLRAWCCQRFLKAGVNFEN